MMDTSFRPDSPSIHPADLEMTWVGDCGQVNRTKPHALDTTRLRAYRQATRGATLSILETGHVSMEFQKRKGDQERAMELFVVSGNGQEINIEQWKAEGPDVSEYSSDRTWKTFKFDSLPEKYWKRYSNACRFVELVKSKTAKVTIYSDRAKGVLMENWPPNFEATFFKGPRILMWNNEIQIKEESGAALRFHRDSINNLVNDYTMELVQHATQMREQCLQLEAELMRVPVVIQGTKSLFPFTGGMRPSSSFCSSTSSNSGSLDFVASPRFNNIISSPSSGSQGHISDTSSPPSPVSQADVGFTKTSAKIISASHFSPTRDGFVTVSSPIRHLSTLEGRKVRCQSSDTSGSRCQQCDSTSPACGVQGHTQIQHNLISSSIPVAQSTPKSLKQSVSIGPVATTNSLVAAGSIELEAFDGSGCIAVVRQTFVPYTGWATHLANGTIWIRYSEGTQLGLNCNQTEVVYIDQQGVIKRYLSSDNIPEVVRLKLEKVPSVIENLYNHPLASPCGLPAT